MGGFIPFAVYICLRFGNGADIDYGSIGIKCRNIVWELFLRNCAIGRPEKNNLAQAIDNARPDRFGILGLLFGGLAAEKDIRHILKDLYGGVRISFTRRGVYEFSHAHLIDNVPVLLSECGTEADNSQK